MATAKRPQRLKIRSNHE